MARGIRVIVLNCDDSYAAPLRAKLLKNDGVKIVAEVDEPALFPSALEQFPSELAVINLESDPEGLTTLISELLNKNPDLCTFGISASNDSNLILRAMRSGFREFLLWPIDDKQLHEAIERLAKASTSQGPSGRLVCVLGPTGGCGATTVATNLGCELAQLGRKRAVVVDLDFAFGHVATLLDTSPQFTIADLCQTLDSVDHSMVEKALIRHESGVMVLARPQHVGQAEQISAANTVGVLNALCEMFEYVVCDGPSRHDTTSPAILDLADFTIMLVNLVVPSVRNVNRILGELQRQGYNLDRLQVVVNRHSSDANLLDIDDMEQCLSRKVDFVLPDDARTVANSINMGQPLLTAAPKSKIREAIRQLAERIHTGKDGNGEMKASNGRAAGLLSRMFK